MQSPTEQLLVEQLFAAYRTAVYTVDDERARFDFKIGEPSEKLNSLLESFGASRAAFVTAENPGSNRLPEFENRRRQADLIETVVCAGYEFLLGRGSDRSGEWTPENSLLIIGIELAAAARLARAFGQNAFVYCEKGSSPVLVNCLKDNALN